MSFTEKANSWEKNRKNLTEYDIVEKYDSQGNDLNYYRGSELDDYLSEKNLKEKIQINQSYCFVGRWANLFESFCLNMGGNDVYQFPSSFSENE